jgi:RNA polymerase sigma-54 factor
MLLQSQSASLRPLTTAHLAQTMSLLELTSEELAQKIESALASNPALEMLDQAHCPSCGRPLRGRSYCPQCVNTAGAADQPIVFVSPRRDFVRPRGLLNDQDENASDDWTAASIDLPTFVLRQIACELTQDDRSIAAQLLTSLDEDGLLTIPLVEVARYQHVPLSRVEAVQRMIQHAEPLGVGSSTPQQALLVQVEALAETRSVPGLTDRAILEGMDLLSRRAYPELARRLGIAAGQAVRIAEFIAENLYPFPARAHWGDIHSGGEARPCNQAPDVVITRLTDMPESPLVVEVVSPYAGWLRVNPLFRQAAAQAPVEKAEAWQADLEEASLLVKCIQQRDHTLVRLMQYLTALQRRYILDGDAFLIPFTRARMAEILDVHESTISRAVAGKAVQLPNRKVVPLSRWFDRSLNVRTALMEIIAQESTPLSDTEIVGLLAHQGFDVARRTVAKYRTMEGILPARLRDSRSRTGFSAASICMGD